MSKLYKNYISLKVQDCSKFYLFKNGFFYIFLDEDARIMSKLLDLKLGNLNSTIVKCGFPETSLTKYLSILKTSDYDISIVPSENILSATSPEEYISFSRFKQIATELVGLDIDNLSISEAFDTLIKLQKEAISIMDEKEI